MRPASQTNRLGVSKGQNSRNQAHLKTLNQRGRSRPRPNRTSKIFNSKCFLPPMMKNLNQVSVKVDKARRRSPKISSSNPSIVPRLVANETLLPAAASGRPAPRTEAWRQVLPPSLCSIIQMGRPQNPRSSQEQQALVSRSKWSRKRRIFHTK